MSSIKLNICVNLVLKRYLGVNRRFGTIYLVTLLACALLQDKSHQGCPFLSHKFSCCDGGNTASVTRFSGVEQQVFPTVCKWRNCYRVNLAYNRALISNFHSEQSCIGSSKLGLLTHGSFYPYLKDPSSQELSPL